MLKYSHSLLYVDFIYIIIRRLIGYVVQNFKSRYCEMGVCFQLVCFQSKLYHFCLFHYPKSSFFWWHSISVEDNRSLGQFLSVQDERKLGLCLNCKWLCCFTKLSKINCITYKWVNEETCPGNNISIRFRNTWQFTFGFILSWNDFHFSLSTDQLFLLQAMLWRSQWTESPFDSTKCNFFKFDHSMIFFVLFER